MIVFGIGLRSRHGHNGHHIIIQSLPLLPGGCGSLVAKVTDSWPTCHEFKPNAAEDPPCREFP
ncbi:UNVERIFIED_CONTAM: hypothetical protein NCL1_04689 [Trichonephila clavipes]